MWSWLFNGRFESTSIWVFPKIGIPQNGWFILENPIKMDDLGVPLFSETSIYIYMYGKTHGLVIWALMMELKNCTLYVVVAIYGWTRIRVSC